MWISVDGPEPQRAVEKRRVPVRHRAVRRDPRMVRAVGFDRVELHQRREHAERGDRRAEHRQRAQRIVRPEPPPDDVLGIAHELRVLLVDHHPEVQRQEHPDRDRQIVDVQRVEMRDQLRSGKIVGAVEHGRRPLPHERHGQRDAVGDAQADPGKVVVRQRVAGEAGQRREDEHRHADHPVELARPAERAGEEDARHVHEDRGDEAQRRPMVDLPDHVADRMRPVGEREHRRIRARLARIEREREPDARRDERHEKVQRELAQIERPVIGIDLREEIPRAGVRAETLVEPAHDAADDHVTRPQSSGPTGPSKSPRAIR